MENQDAINKNLCLNVMTYLKFLKEKINEVVKACGCADG